MKPYEITLRKDGFYVGVKPVKASAFIGYWSVPLVIAPDVTFGDFAAWLRVIPSKLLKQLEQLTDTNVRPFLGDDPSSVETVAPDVQAVEIYSYVELDNYTEPAQPFEFKYVIGCHGAAAVSGVADEEPIPYALEFTPWGALEHLPLRLNYIAVLCRSTWRAIPPEPNLIAVYHADGSSTYEDVFGPKTRESEAMTTENVNVGYYTLGAVFTALLHELCFFGSPAVRDAKLEELQERTASIPHDDA